MKAKALVFFFFAFTVASPAGSYSRFVLLLLQFTVTSDLVISAWRQSVPASQHDPRTGEKGMCAVAYVYT